MQDKLMTYVHDGKEVILTGRVAVKNEPSKSNVKMVEVVPVGEDISSKTFARWVKLEDLLVVVDTEQNTEIHFDET